MNIYDVHEPDYDVLFSPWYSTALAWERFPLQAFTGRVSPFGPLCPRIQSVRQDYQRASPLSQHR